MKGLGEESLPSPSLPAPSPAAHSSWEGGGGRGVCRGCGAQLSSDWWKLPHGFLPLLETS